MGNITPRTIKAFFNWLLNQRRGKGGRRVKGVKSESSLSTYYKTFRLVCERETGTKIGEGDKGFNRKVNRVSHISHSHSVPQVHTRKAHKATSRFYER
jgi:hypothetical protein